MKPQISQNFFCEILKAFHNSTLIFSYDFHWYHPNSHSWSFAFWKLSFRVWFHLINLLGFTFWFFSSFSNHSFLYFSFDHLFDQIWFCTPKRDARQKRWVLWIYDFPSASHMFQCNHGISNNRPPKHTNWCCSEFTGRLFQDLKSKHSYFISMFIGGGTHNQMKILCFSVTSHLLHFSAKDMDRISAMLSGCSWMAVFQVVSHLPWRKLHFCHKWCQLRLYPWICKPPNFLSVYKREYLLIIDIDVTCAEIPNTHIGMTRMFLQGAIFLDDSYTHLVPMGEAFHQNLKVGHCGCRYQGVDCSNCLS